MTSARTMSSWLLELDGKTVIIPMANVRYIEITPALTATRESIIKGTTVK